MDRELVKELIQHNFNEKNIEHELNAILFDKEYRKNMLSDFDLLREKLGSAGASNRFAKEIVSSIND